MTSERLEESLTVFDKRGERYISDVIRSRRWRSRKFQTDSIVRLNSSSIRHWTIVDTSRWRRRKTRSGFEREIGGWNERRSGGGEI
jgi:hypothetical protein